ncbi:MAG: hypothetical protein AB1611_16410 [bacterium]
MSRIFDPSREAIKEILGFDLAETRAGQDIFQEVIKKVRQDGIEEGIKIGRLEGLFEAIKLGMGLKFGLEGIKLLPRIAKEKDITKLDTIKTAIRLATSVKDILATSVKDIEELLEIES